MGYDRFVQIGRVAYIAAGPDQVNLVAIANVIDQNRALIDGPCSGVSRKQINFKLLHLTRFVLKLGVGARTGTVKAAWEKADINKQWADTTWAKKLQAKQKRTELSDFDRFKLMKAKQSRNRLISIEYGKQSKSVKPKPKRIYIKKKQPTKK